MIRKMRISCLLCVTLLPLWVSGCGKPEPEEIFREGAQLVSQGNYVSARHRFQEIVDNYPDFDFLPAAYFQIGDCFNNEQRPNDARAIYRLLLTDYPDSKYAWQANIRLGDMAYEDKDFPDAEDYYKAAISLATDEQRKLTAIQNLARNQLASGSMEVALETMQSMLDETENPATRLSVLDKISNLQLGLGQFDEAWETITGFYDPNHGPPGMRQFLQAVLDKAARTNKFQEGVEFYDHVVETASHEYNQAAGLHFKAMLMSGTTSMVKEAVTTLDQLRDEFGHLPDGRWAPVDAAVTIVTASFEFGTPAEAIALASDYFAAGLSSYDDLIHDQTIEWFEPHEAAWGWEQVAAAQEVRGRSLRNLDDLMSASATYALIIDKFESLPRLRRSVQMAAHKSQQLAAMIKVADTSPEEFWQHVAIRRAWPEPIAQADPAAEGSSAPATESTPAAAADSTPEVSPVPDKSEAQITSATPTQPADSKPVVEDATPAIQPPVQPAPETETGLGEAAVSPETDTEPAVTEAAVSSATEVQADTQAEPAPSAPEVEEITPSTTDQDTPEPEENTTNITPEAAADGLTAEESVGTATPAVTSGTE